MNRSIIIVAGYLAAGKSTFAVKLSRTLGIPYFVKDTFKTALCASIPIDNRVESSRFSAITFDAMMYAAERLMETGFPLILEGNLVSAGVKKTDESAVIRSIINKHNYQPLTFKFTGDTQVLFKRFTERERLPERGQANMMFAEVSYNEFDCMCKNLDDFSVCGQIVEVDTTDFASVDFESYIETTRQFIRCNHQSTYTY